MRAVDVDGGTLAVDDRGSGDPILLVHGGLIADSMRPLADALLRTGRRVVRPHRAGYGAGTAPARTSVGAGADDHAAVLDALEIPAADVVGWSYGGAVALELARRRPGGVRTLALLEPALFAVPSAAGFVAAAQPAATAWRQGRRAEAVDLLQTAISGPDWAVRLERALPGVAADAERDLDAGFAGDLPSLSGWDADPGTVATTHGDRTLYVGGSASGPMFDEIAALIVERVPAVTEVVLYGADHTFALTRAEVVADTLTAFLGRTPVAGAVRG